MRCWDCRRQDWTAGMRARRRVFAMKLAGEVSQNACADAVSWGVQGPQVRSGQGKDWARAMDG